MSDRDLDVVVFGGTGVTGRRVAAYLADRSRETGARWGAAARDAGKLERVLGEAGVSVPEAIVADVQVPASLAEMASRARVVLNLVGPYTRFGRPVIEACVAAGTHYVDLTGEIPFVRRIVDELDARAREAGVKVVQVCGFESLPPDLAVLLAAETARERWGEGLAEVDLELSAKGPPGIPRLSDLVSGGTLQSSAAIATADGAPAITDPAALIADPTLAAEVRRRSPISIAPRRSDGAVIAPMAPAAFINPAVIHRTEALRAAEGGVDAQPFRYREGLAIPGGAATLPLRYALAGTLSGTQAAIGKLAHARPSIRQRAGAAMRKVLPSSGFGPAEERLDLWSWRMAVEGRTGGGHQVGVNIEAEGNPGYLATARMLGEAGLLLAEPGLLLAEPGPTPERAGCLTPATALGTASIERFEHASLRFRVVE